ncbi:MAG: hypothetical protein GX416_08485 [Bacteroidales bacterium]|nr:hypothetical protein [Bacteroidales bacterium]
MKTIYNKINYCAAIIILLCAMSACGYSEDALTPSGDALAYKLPQGNSDYDQTIVDYYNKYGVYILYKFQNKEAYWTPSGWQNGIIGVKSGMGGFSVLPTDPAYVKQQLSLIKELWFDSYNDAFLKANLPAKILLCAEVDSIAEDWSTWPASYIGFKIGAWYNYYNICVGYGDGTTSAQLTADDKRKLKDKWNRVFIQNIVDRGAVAMPAEFSSAVNYTSVTNLDSNSKLWALGALGPSSTATPIRDWGYFMLMMICHSETFLNTVPTNIIDWDTSEASWEGILSPAKDTNGLLKKRYNMVRNYYIQKCNIDLQQIGNNLNN